MYKIIGANQAEYGPVTAEQIRQWIAENRVNAATSAQTVGETGWRPISSFPEFAAHFPSNATPPPLSPPPIPQPPPPSFAAAPHGNVGRAGALDQVNGPAVGLMIVGILGIIYALVAVMANLTGIASGLTFNSFGQFNGRGFQGPNPEFLKMMQGWSGFTGVIFSLAHAALAGFILYGALQMKKLENHSLCLGAAIVALLPCCGPCCFFNIGIAIWALVVLNKPEVRNYFS